MHTPPPTPTHYWLGNRIKRHITCHIWGRRENLLFISPPSPLFILSSSYHFSLPLICTSFSSAPPLLTPSIQATSPLLPSLPLNHLFSHCSSLSSNPSQINSCQAAATERTDYFKLGHQDINLKKQTGFFLNTSTELLERCRVKSVFSWKKILWWNNSKTFIIFTFKQVRCQTDKDLWADSITTLISLVFNVSSPTSKARELPAFGFHVDAHQTGFL